MFQDPLLMYPRNKGTVRNFETTWEQSSVSFVKTSFQAHVKLESAQTVNSSHQVPEANLIEL